MDGFKVGAINASQWNNQPKKKHEKKEKDKDKKSSPKDFKSIFETELNRRA